MTFLFFIKELKDKIEAETNSSQFLPMPCYSYDASPSFSLDDFEGECDLTGSLHGQCMICLKFYLRDLVCRF